MADEILGADEAAVLGALRRGRRGVPTYSKPPLATNQTAPRAKIRAFCGLGIATWGAADATDKVLTVEPQEPFRGERLVVTVLATGGVAAGLTTVKLITVGTQPQQPSVEQAAPASMFAADATYSGLDLQVAKPGVKVAVTLGQTAAPGAGVTVTAACGMYGEWIR